MKKFLFFICVGLMLTVFCSASVKNGTCIEFENENISVYFSETSQLSDSQKLHAANHLVYGSENSDVQPASILCLFGHNITTETVSVVHHRVRDKVPRCDISYYSCKTCKNCDYESFELDRTEPLFCHPEE